MKRWVLVIIMVAVVTACGGEPVLLPTAETVGKVVESPEPVDEPTRPLPADNPTATPLPTAPPLPTDTPVPTATPAHTVRPLAELPLPPLPQMFPKIDRRPHAPDVEIVEMQAVPTYNPASGAAPDLRGYDLSQLDLGDAFDDLMMATFDDRTKWPTAAMPDAFDPGRIMELGKNPGLGLRALHQKGITGRGVGIAIIDHALLVSHNEYAGQLRLYEEINYDPEWSAQMHGAAVASIAVGKTVGVAPGADLYFIAASFSEPDGAGGDTLNYEYVAQSIHRVLAVNESLPEGRKIRVISISRGWMPGEKGYEAVTAAVAEAQAAGVLVVHASMAAEWGKGFAFHGLGRDPLADPDAFGLYEPGLWWLDEAADQCTGRLFVPMDSRTVASPTGDDEYTFYREGGWSWSIPYLAGAYALAVQVNPELTPDEFMALARDTGRIVGWRRGPWIIDLGPILDPAGAIQALQER